MTSHICSCTYSHFGKCTKKAIEKQNHIPLILRVNQTSPSTYGCGYGNEIGGISYGGTTCNLSLRNLSQESNNRCHTGSNFNRSS